MRELARYENLLALLDLESEELLGQLNLQKKRLDIEVVLEHTKLQNQIDSIDFLSQHLLP